MKSFSMAIALFKMFFYGRTAGGNRFGVFRPIVFGVTAAHFGTHQTPAAAPEAGQVAGYLHRAAGRGQEFKPQRQAVSSHAGVDSFAVELLNGNLQGRLFSGVVDCDLLTGGGEIFIRTTGIERGERRIVQRIFQNIKKVQLFE